MRIDGFLLFVGVVAVVLFGGVFVLLVNQQGRIDNFNRDCYQRDGHIYGDGLRLCLTEDGRVLEATP